MPSDSTRRRSLVDAVPVSLRRRLAIYYIVLFACTAGAAAALLTIGSHKHAQPAIAGGYDVGAGARCLGAKIQLIQSGRYVDFQTPSGTGIGKLNFNHGRLSGKVSCGHASFPLAASVAHGTITGRLGTQPLLAVMRTSPPTPGTVPPQPPGSVDGNYALSPRSNCLGGSLTLAGDNRLLAVHAGSRKVGTAHYAHGQLAGAVRCQHGGAASLAGRAAGRTIDLAVGPAAAATAALGGAPPQAGVERLTATAQRTLDETVALFFVAIVIVMLVAWLGGSLMRRIGQPRVMGEVIGGILLGPTLLGAVAPGVEAAIFPSDIIPILGVAANLGLIFYMFIVGLELDFSRLRGRIAQTVAISNTSVALPMIAGLAIAVPLYSLLAPPSRFAGFALFMGVAMSITAFPVLARIIVERRMLKRPMGALALASAAVDDITAWFLIALATAVAAAGSGLAIVRTIALAAAFVAVMFGVVRPLLKRASIAYDEAGRVPAGWVVVIFAAVLLSAYTTQKIGIAVIFGAFIMGVVMPRHAGLTADITHRIEDFVVVLLLPLFFAFTGLRTNFLLLNRSSLVLITVALTAIAIAGKFGGAVIAGRVTRMSWREAGVIGTLMNTRGLTELIVLNLALGIGAITSALFAALVIMALVTTFMTGPLLKLLDPTNSFGEVEEDLERARRESAEHIAVPERSILVAPQSDWALPQLLAVGEQLAASEPPRELIIAKLIRPPRGGGARAGLQAESEALEQSTAEVEAERVRLLRERIAARAVAFTSADPGADLVRLGDSEHVDLILTDGRRPLLGSGVPRGDVGTILRNSDADVAVMVAREQQQLTLDAYATVMVPFGGAEHDWAALELGAWIAHSSGAGLKLLGAAGVERDGRDPSRLLANASLVVQQFVGVPAAPVLVDDGKSGLVEAAADADLLVIGLSDRWRREGLGRVRAEVARAAPAPILFVRRGSRPGALAPRDNVTRFTWSSPAVGTPAGQG